MLYTYNSELINNKEHHTGATLEEQENDFNKQTKIVTMITVPVIIIICMIMLFYNLNLSLIITFSAFTILLVSALLSVKKLALLKDNKEKWQQLATNLQQEKFELSVTVKLLRKREEETNANEKQLKNLFQHLSAPYFSFDSKGIIKDCNTTLYTALGYEKISEVIGCSLDNFLTIDSAIKSKDAIPKLMQNGYCQRELNFQKKDGSTITFLVDGSAIYDDQGQFTHSQCIAIDITQRKLGEQVTRQFETFFNNLPDVAYIRDREGFFITVNDCLLEDIKTTKDDIIGKKASDFVSPDHLEKFDKAFNQILKTKKPVLQDYTAKIATGIKHCRSRIFPLFDLDGNVSSVATITIDITEKHQKEMELAICQAQIKAIIDNSPAMIYAKDIEGQYTLMSQSFKNFFKIDPEKAIGKTDQQLFSKENADKFLARDKQLAGDSSLAIEETIKDEFDNSEVTLYTNNFFIKDQNGKIDGIAGISSDITPVIRMQQLLKEQMRKTEEATRIKTDFLANMSHEIRTPLNGILGFIELLMKNDLTAKQKDYVDKMNFSSKSLLNIINEILDFSKLEAGKLEIEQTNFILEHTLQMVMQSIPPKSNDINLDYQLDQRIPQYLVGDQHRITQVLCNLVANAIKFTEAGNVQIKVDLLEHKQCYNKIKFCVSDTGIGLSKESQSRLFKPFTQADSSTSRKYGGTGLGLNICKNIVSLMDGEIGVHSTLGSGSTFWFTITLRSANESELAIVNHSDTKLIDLVNTKVLLVEDNDLNQYVATELLSEEGLIVEIANNGSEALPMLQKKKYDVVLMDVNMPVMDGYEATREIRQQEEFKFLPIIAMTANAMRPEKIKCLDAGMNDHISKPFDSAELFRKIDFWINKLKGSSKN